MTAIPQCRHCAEPMEAGYMPDLGHAQSRRVEEWVEGPPEKAFWMGLKLDDRRRLKVDGLALSDVWAAGIVRELTNGMVPSL